MDQDQWADSEAIRRVLLQLLDEQAPVGSSGGRTFAIPANISGKYTIMMGLSLRDLAIYVAPVLGVVAVLFAIPPWALAVIAAKAVVSLLLLAASVALPSTHPIPSRPNLTMYDWLRTLWAYHRRQRQFFFRPTTQRGIIYGYTTITSQTTTTATAEAAATAEYPGR